MIYWHIIEVLECKTNNNQPKERWDTICKFACAARDICSYKSNYIRPSNFTMLLTTIQTNIMIYYCNSLLLCCCCCATFTRRLCRPSHCDHWEWLCSCLVAVVWNGPLVIVGGLKNDSNGQNAMRQYEFLCAFTPWDLARNHARSCTEATGRIT
jgi:hypothetical protein